MAYYNEKMNAYRYLRQVLMTALNEGKELNRTALILEMTSKFPTSDIAIKKRLDMYEELGYISSTGSTIKTNKELP